VATLEFVAHARNTCLTNIMDFLDLAGGELIAQPPIVALSTLLTRLDHFIWSINHVIFVQTCF